MSSGVCFCRRPQMLVSWDSPDLVLGLDASQGQGNGCVAPGGAGVEPHTSRE